MSVLQELRDYFSKLIQPLATNERLEQMSQKLKEEIVTKFEERFIQQNKKTYELEERVSFQENPINQLLIKCDGNEHIVDGTVYGFIKSTLETMKKQMMCGKK